MATKTHALCKLWRITILSFINTSPPEELGSRLTTKLTSSFRFSLDDHREDFNDKFEALFLSHSVVIFPNFLEQNNKKVSPSPCSFCPLSRCFGSAFSLFPWVWIRRTGGRTGAKRRQKAKNSGLSAVFFFLRSLALHVSCFLPFCFRFVLISLLLSRAQLVPYSSGSSVLQFPRFTRTSSVSFSSGVVTSSASGFSPSGFFGHPLPKHAMNNWTAICFFALFSASFLFSHLQFKLIFLYLPSKPELFHSTKLVREDTVAQERWLSERAGETLVNENCWFALLRKLQNRKIISWQKSLSPKLAFIQGSWWILPRKWGLSGIDTRKTFSARELAHVYFDNLNSDTVNTRTTTSTKCTKTAMFWAPSFESLSCSEPCVRKTSTV